MFWRWWIFSSQVGSIARKGSSDETSDRTHVVVDSIGRLEWKWLYIECRIGTSNDFRIVSARRWYCFRWKCSISSDASPIKELITRDQLVLGDPVCAALVEDYFLFSLENFKWTARNRTVMLSVMRNHCFRYGSRFVRVFTRWHRRYIRKWGTKIPVITQRRTNRWKQKVETER